jgi:lysophospholipase L1-like esterase
MKKTNFHLSKSFYVFALLILSNCNGSQPLPAPAALTPTPTPVVPIPIVFNLPQRANLLGEYLLLEGTGTTINDTSGNKNTATLTGAAWESTRDLNFTAQGQFISLPVPLNQLNTLQVVLYEPTFGNGQVSTGYGNAAGAPANMSIFCGTDAAHSCIITGGGRSQRFQAFNSDGTTSSQPMTAGWHVVTLVSGQGAALDHIYYDGLEVSGYLSQSSGFFLHPATGTYQIGGSAQYTQTWFFGKIAAAWAWSTSLSAFEVSAAYVEALNFAAHKGVQSLIPPIVHSAPLIIGGLDSRTAGLGLSTANNIWINSLTLTDGTYTTLNLSSSGAWAVDTGYSFNVQHAPYINPYSGPTIEVLWGGVNDMLYSGYSARQIADGLKSLVQQAKALGARVVLATETSFNGGDAQKNALNTIIRSEAFSWGADNIADLGDSPQVGADGTYAGANFADGLHPNDTGENYVRAIMNNAINELIGSTASARHRTAAATYTETAGDRFLDLTAGVAQTITLPSCVGYSLQREIVNLGTSAATLATTNAEVLTGSTSLPVFLRAIVTPIPGPPATGGCSWERVQ